MGIRSFLKVGAGFDFLSTGGRAGENLSLFFKNCIPAISGKKGDHIQSVSYAIIAGGMVIYVLHHYNKLGFGILALLVLYAMSFVFEKFFSKGDNNE